MELELHYLLKGKHLKIKWFWTYSLVELRKIDLSTVSLLSIFPALTLSLLLLYIVYFPHCLMGWCSRPWPRTRPLMWVRVGRMADLLVWDLGLSAPLWPECVFPQYKWQFAVNGWLEKCLGGALSAPKVCLSNCSWLFSCSLIIVKWSIWQIWWIIYLPLNIHSKHDLYAWDLRRHRKSNIPADTSSIHHWCCIHS